MVVAHIALTGLTDLAPAPDGVWYLRIDGAGGHVGLASTDGSVREATTGPTPAAIASAGASLYVVEGTSENGNADRTNVLERLDPTTLVVMATVPISSPTDVVVDGGTVWAATTRGTVEVLGPDLVSIATIEVGGSGPAQAIAVDRRVWVLNGRADPPAHLVHVIAEADRSVTTIELPGGGSFGALTSAVNTVYAGTLGGGPGLGHLVGINPDLSERTLATIPAPAGLAVLGDRIWWVGVDGRVGAVDRASGAVGRSIATGATGACLTASGEVLWVCADDLVVLRPVG